MYKKKIFIAAYYRRIVPLVLRQYIYKYSIAPILLLLDKAIRLAKGTYYLCYYSIFSPKNEKEVAYRIWGKNPFSMYPYAWLKEYDKKYCVFLDPNNGLSYVNHNTKRLYFKRGLSNYDVINLYKSLLIEQDSRSAHCYLRDKEIVNGRIVLDIGAAEAIFTLNIIDRIRHAYLFECDEEWIEALYATFSFCEDKITIIRKYVSDVDDENNLTLDSYFKNNINVPLLIKMDIEGAERKALKGAINLLSLAPDIYGAISIYHLKDDKDVILGLLEKCNLKLSVQPGFLYRGWDMSHGILCLERLWF